MRSPYAERSHRPCHIHLAAMPKAAASPTADFAGSPGGPGAGGIAGALVMPVRALDLPMQPQTAAAEAANLAWAALASTPPGFPPSSKDRVERQPIVHQVHPRAQHCPLPPRERR